MTEPMMDTDHLIDSLAHDIRPVPRHVVGWRIAMGVSAGALIAAVLVAAWLGLRPDLAVAMRGFPFWMKWTYTLCLALVAITATARLARPTGTSLWSLWALAIPALLLTGLGIGELASTPAQQWLALWLGHSWRVCPWLVLMLAIPIFAGLLWSFRALAPVRLRAAGATAGMASGAWAATIYCLHCPEVSALFVLSWYSLGIILATAFGALMGPRLMRW